jgi:beta-1,4-mannosyl-glycoprotein beta-1,4-N-acetylglucosaminyltransferase
MIIDAFIFNDELDLLELRLGQLSDVVDHFVFVEADRTFMGTPKPLYYQDNKNLFSKWHDKIKHVVCPPNQSGSWEFEKVQREVLVNVIHSLNPSEDDTLSFSDLDEIPNPEVVKAYTPDMGLRTLRQYTFYYNFNHCMNYGDRAWSRARIGRIRDMHDRGGVVEFRGGVGDMDPNFPYIENGGWHGSYFNQTVEKTRRKVYSISHDDLHPYIKSRTDKQIAEDILNGRDLYHRSGISDAQLWDTNDPRLPSYFLSNKERFKMFTNEYFYQTNKLLLEGPDIPHPVEKPVAPIRRLQHRLSR